MQFHVTGMVPNSGVRVRGDVHKDLLYSFCYVLVGLFVIG